jgi:hypothetical protein
VGADRCVALAVPTPDDLGEGAELVAERGVGSRDAGRGDEVPAGSELQGGEARVAAEGKFLGVGQAIVVGIGIGCVGIEKCVGISGEGDGEAAVIEGEGDELGTCEVRSGICGDRKGGAGLAGNEGDDGADEAVVGTVDGVAAELENDAGLAIGDADAADGDDGRLAILEDDGAIGGEADLLAEIGDGDLGGGRCADLVVAGLNDEGEIFGGFGRAIDIWRDADGCGVRTGWDGDAGDDVGKIDAVSGVAGDEEVDREGSGGVAGAADGEGASVGAGFAGRSVACGGRNLDGWGEAIDVDGASSPEVIEAAGVEVDAV